MSGKSVVERSVDELIDGWEAAWSGKEREAFDAVCHEDIHYEDPLVPEPIDGPAAVAAHAARLWAAFPDARLQSLGGRLTDGHYVAAPSKLLATHRESLGGLPATNRFIVVPCIFYCELAPQEGGPMLMRVRTFFDVYDAAVQLGVLPGRGTLGEKALLMLRGFGVRAGR